MKNKKNKIKSNNITFKTINEKVDLIKKNEDLTVYKKKAKRIRDNTTKLLDEFITQKYITGYEINKNGTLIESITIQF